MQVTLIKGFELSPAQLAPAIAFVVLTFVTHAALAIFRCHADQLLLPIVSTLSGVGLLIMYRLSQADLVNRQTIWAVISFGAMLATLAVIKDPPRLRHYRYISAIAGLLLVAVTFVIGSAPPGSDERLWIVVGPLQYQPSEILKILLVIFFAAYLDEYRELLSRGRYRLGPLTLPPLPYLLPLLAMWGISLLLLTVQRDLGGALLFFGIFLAMLYVGSSRASWVCIALMAFGVAATAAYQVVSVVQRRVEGWVDPWSHASDSGYQIIQGLIALAAGGIFGSGLGYGRPTSVPAVHTDLIIAAIGEEMGLLGTFGVLILYMLLIYRGFRIAVAAANSFNQLLAAGLTSVLALQTLVILGGSVRLLPLTGVTLPLVSYGGSSLLANFIIIGLLLRISHNNAREVARAQGSA